MLLLACYNFFTMVSRAELELLLKTQRESYNDSTDHLVNAFNLRVSKLEKDLLDSKSEIASLQRENQEKDIAINSLTDRLSQLEAATQTNPATSLLDRLDGLEDHSRRNNIKIEGLPEADGGENWEQTAACVSKLIKDKLEISEEVLIERAHRVGQRSSQKPRSVIAKFLRFKDREAILKNSRKLKGTNIYVNEDLCEASRAKRREQLPKLREARSLGKIAYFSHTKLIIKDRPQNPQDWNNPPPPPRTSSSDNSRGRKVPRSGF